MSMCSCLSCCWKRVFAMTSVSSGKTLLHLSCLPTPVHFSSLITKIWISLLPSPVWPHPTYLHSWPSHSRFLSNTVLYSIGLFFYCQTHWQLSSFHFGLASSFFLELLVIALHSSLVAYWTPLTWRAHLPVSYLFAFSFCSWGSPDETPGVGCHFLLQWTMFCQNSSVWPVRLGWHCMAWLIGCDLWSGISYAYTYIHSFFV